MIAGSSAIESACTVVRTMDTIAILNRVLTDCDFTNCVTNRDLKVRIEGFVLVARSLLCVVATPFIGVSIVSHSSGLSVLSDYGMACFILCCID